MIVLSANSSWYLYNFRRNTILSLLNQGYSITCLSKEDEYTQKIKDLGCKWESLNIDGKGLNIYHEFKLLISFYKIFKRLRPRVVLNFTIKNNIYGTFASKLLYISSINNISGLGTAFIHNDIKFKLVRLLYSFALPLSTKIFCQNSEDKDLLVTKLGVKAELIDITPGSGVDINRFNPKKKTRIICPDNKFRFIYTGRFIKDKGIFELIEAFKQLYKENANAELWLVGFRENDNFSAINSSTIKEWSDHPSISILNPTHEIENILGDADCLVLPSYREGLSKSILEACAMSLPVICSNVPGCNSVIQDGVNGLYCKPKNSNSLKKVMNNMLSMEKTAIDNMGKRGRKIIKEKFDESIVINQTLNAIKEVYEI